MQEAAKLGISVTVSKVGNDLPTTGTPATVSPVQRPNEWQPAITIDEDSLLHQLRATLVQALDTSICKSRFLYHLLYFSYYLCASFYRTLYKCCCARSKVFFRQYATVLTTELYDPYYTRLPRCHY